MSMRSTRRSSSSSSSSRSSSSRPGLYMSSGGFSSMSLGSYNTSKFRKAANPEARITAVTVNKSLLTPMAIDIDPSIQVIRSQEKEQIKSLNNRFVSFIDKVRLLEQQNKLLETKWKMVQGQTTADSDIEPMLKCYISNLQKQLTCLNNDTDKLNMENSAMHRHVDDYKTKYEQEINKRNDAENEFVLFKKDVDSGYISKVELEERVSTINGEFNFYKALYDEELRELQESLKETSVVVQMDNSRALNMDQIVSEVKAQYEDIAARSRQDAESWYKNKFDQMAADADQHANQLRSTKAEISELNRMISRLQIEIEAVKAQHTNLKDQIDETEVRGEGAVQDARARIRDLELALQRAKRDMTQQVREYQELMNVKLALDIEISTYRKLLEGEEERLGQDSIINIQTVPNKTVQVSTINTQQPQRSSAVFIKTVQTKNTTYN